MSPNMFLAYIGILATIFGCSASEAPRALQFEGPSPDVYNYEPSADAIFYKQLAKFHTRKGKINVTEIVALLKNGSAVASKVQSTFEKVYELKDGPINVNDLIEVGKEVYDVGKEVYEVGKQVFEVGKEILDVGKEFFEKHKAVLQVGKTMAKTLGSIATCLGPALGGVGIAFAFITMFMPKEDSEDLKAIKAGFKEMHHRFDQVSNQISMLESKIDFYQAITPYQHVRDSMENVYRDYINLAEVPTSAAYKKAFRDACKNQHIEPLQALEKLRRIIVTPGPEDQPHMVKSIITHHKLDYKTTMAWFERITQNALTLATLRSACFGTLHGEDDQARSHSLNQTEIWVKDIVGELAKWEERFTSIEEEFSDVLQRELEDVASKVPSTNATAEKELNLRCEKWEKELTGYTSFCYGDDAVNAKRVAVNTFLNTKYYWLNWMVVVYQGVEHDRENPCHHAKPGQHWLQTKSANDQRVLVSWARRDAEEAAVLRTEAYANMDMTLKGYNRDKADTWGTFFGAVGKYFTSFNNHMNKEIEKWMATKQYKNKLHCSIGGYTGTYKRSIVTSGVAAHRAQVASRYIVDYLVAFY